MCHCKIRADFVYREYLQILSHNAKEKKNEEE